MNSFSALSDPTRRKILNLIAKQGALSATKIGAHFPISPPAISQHLKVLREAKFVRMEKRAQQRIYSLNPQALREMEDWARQIIELWNQRFDALERVIAEEKKKTTLSDSERES